MNEYQEPADDTERAVATLLADVGAVARSCPPRFTATDIKVSAVRSQSRKRQLERYRRPAWAWLAVMAVLAVVLVLGVRLTTLSTPHVVTPASRPSTKITSPPRTTPTSPKTSLSTSPKTSLSTSPKTSLSTSTTVAGLLPVFLAPGYDGRTPVDIYLSGDAGNIVTGLEWSSWTGVEAVGHGTSNQEGCVPDCASGTQTPEPTTVVLSDPVDGHYTHMTEMREGETEIFTYPPSTGHPWAEEAYNTPPS